MGALAPFLAVARAVGAWRTAQPCPGADLRPGPGNAPEVDRATVCLINEVRASHRLRPLRANRDLQRVASGQVGHMVRWNYFADIRPSGRTPASLIASTRYAAHAPTLSTGQNIGWATGPDATAAAMVGAWMASPPHRAVILARNFRDVGVGVSSVLPAILRRDSGAVYAVEFARTG